MKMATDTKTFLDHCMIIASRYDRLLTELSKTEG
jgi:hypothetical protein